MGEDVGMQASEGLALGWFRAAESVQEVTAAVARVRAGDPLARVTVVVPTKVAGLGLRRALAARPGGSVGVQVLVLEQVAELLAAPDMAASARRPLSDDVRLLLVEEALRRRPGALAGVADHPATVDAVDRAVRTLRTATAATDPAPVLAALDRLEPDGVHGALAGIAREVWGLAEDHHDADDLLLTAATSPADRVRDQVGALIVHQPAQSTPAGGVLVRALAQHVPVVVQLADTGDGDADDATHADAMALTRGDVPSPPGAAPEVELGVVVVTDADEEVRQATRAIVGAMHRGVDPSAIRVLYRAQDPYPSLVPAVLAAAGVPFNGPADRNLGQTRAARWLTELWAWHDDEHPRARLMDLLGSMPVRWRDRRVPATRWDAVARSARVIGGARQWDDRLRGFERRLTDQLEGGVADWLRDRLDRQRQDARDLADFVAELVDELRAPGVESWSAWSAWALSLLDRLGRDRHGWTELDREAEGLLRQRLETLAQLDEVRGRIGLPPGGVTRDEFRHAVLRELEVSAGRLGRAGVGVHVGPVGSAGHLPAAHTIIVGVVEGQFPPRPRAGALLPDSLLESVAEELADHADVRAAWATVPGSDQRVDHLRRALARLLATSDRVTFMVPRVDRRSERPARPAPWLLQLLAQRVERPVAVDDLLRPPTWLAPYVHVVDSAVAGVLDAEAPGGVAELRRRVLARHAGAGGDVGQHPLAADLDGLAHAVDVTVARRGDRFTAWDGHVADRAATLVAAAERPSSPNNLATYGACPRRWFFEQVLYVRESDEPRSWLTVDALDRGNLLHRVLELWVREQLEDATPPPDVDAARAGSLDRLRQLFDAGARQLELEGLVGHTGLWVRERERLWRLVLDWHGQHQRRVQDGLRPVALEQRFGTGDDLDVLELPTSEGVTFRFRGVMDRVDVDEAGGRVVVYDYKTSTPDTYRGLDQDVALSGTELQLPVYGLVAAREHPGADVGLSYWHLHDKAPRQGPTVVPFDDRARRRVQEVLDAMAAGIRDGVFPADPGEEQLWPVPGWSNCRWCPFDRICPSHAERGRAARRDLESEPAQVLRPLVQSEVLGEDGA